MGRLIRKKSNGKPKASSEKVQSVSGPATGNRAPAKGAATGGASRQPKAPANYPGKKYVDVSLQFLREVRFELRKVTWPSRKQTVGSTIVVIILVLIISAFLGVVDAGLQGLINVVIQ
jgi:preprotein translocase subunit SecE